MSEQNRYGLSRHIPQQVKLAVRQASKFGCVMCRSAIYQYEHIEPTFAEVRSHDAEHICLLCGRCHDRVTKGRVSKQAVAEAYLRCQRDPAIRPPFDSFDLTGDPITIELGSATFEGARALFTVDGQDVLAIHPPEQPGGPPRLSGVFCDAAGNELLRIEDNEYTGSIDAWDIETVGAKTTVKIAAGVTALRLHLKPPSRIDIEVLDMAYEGCHLLFDAEAGAGFLVGRMFPSYAMYLGLHQFHCVGADRAIDIDAQSFPSPEFQGVEMRGGAGVLLTGTGITVGRGAGSVLIPEVLALRHAPVLRTAEDFGRIARLGRRDLARKQDL